MNNLVLPISTYDAPPSRRTGHSCGLRGNRVRYRVKYHPKNQNKFRHPLVLYRECSPNVAGESERRQVIPGDNSRVFPDKKHGKTTYPLPNAGTWESAPCPQFHNLLYEGGQRWQLLSQDNYPPDNSLTVLGESAVPLRPLSY